MTTQYRRQYGDTYVDGNATAHLGDQHNTNNVRIEAVYLARQNELDLPRIVSRKGRSRKTASRIANNGHSYRKPVKKPRNDRAPQKSQTDTSVLQRLDGDHAIARIPPGTDMGLLHQLRRLAQPFLQPATTDEPPSRSDVGKQLDVTKTKQSIISSSIPGGRERNLLLIGTTILSCVLGKDVLPDEAVNLARRWLQDKNTSILLMLLLVGLYRFVLTPRIVTNPSLESVILEDAYGRLRSISIDVCRSFPILSSFLETHYEETLGTTAGALVKARQFHLTLESRRGAVVDPKDWRVEDFRVGRRVVNSVYVDREAPECLLCSATFVMTAFGEFRCPGCQVFHRQVFKDNNEVKPEISAANTPVRPEQGRASEDRTSTAPQQLGNGARPIEPLKNIKFDGLKHIDLRIVQAIRAKSRLARKGNFTWGRTSRNVQEQMPTLISAREGVPNGTNSDIARGWLDTLPQDIRGEVLALEGATQRRRYRVKEAEARQSDEEYNIYGMWPYKELGIKRHERQSMTPQQIERLRQALQDESDRQQQMMQQDFAYAQHYYSSQRSPPPDHQNGHPWPTRDSPGHGPPWTQEMASAVQMRRADLVKTFLDLPGGRSSMGMDEVYQLSVMARGAGMDELAEYLIRMDLDPEGEQDIFSHTSHHEIYMQK